MTNREWLNSLSNEDFVNWLYVERTKIFDPKKGETVVIAPNYSPCLHEVTMEWNSGQLRLKAWLSEKRK